MHGNVPWSRVSAFPSRFLAVQATPVVYSEAASFFNDSWLSPSCYIKKMKSSLVSLKKSQFSNKLKDTFTFANNLGDWFNDQPPLKSPLELRFSCKQTCPRAAQTGLRYVCALLFGRNRFRPTRLYRFTTSASRPYQLSPSLCTTKLLCLTLLSISVIWVLVIILN